ncbi:NAD(P)/FAD-dependent oxidoreductase [Chitinophaga sp. Cy-1792]|uniref:FAD-dependent oxidoreductase n=1 Tax=Chitinophaga sp. Cy-1792 TaxID=2608339 RepID=UPI001422C189|nr:NAD(P)/FAD-dependent oxidoreductase [Chitinophaga sp. Cy-1792]NIG55126.1 FAD-dependent monooxygenase [Chitinophaga sp. Cy-1792]
MQLIKDKQIAIVGGGPGGLTLARLLQMKGAQVKVYERDLNRQVRVQGATLDLHEDAGLLALEHAGLMEAFKKYYRPGADRIRIMDKDARILYDEHHAAHEGWNRPEIDRGPLRELMLNSLQDDTVTWDSQFVSMEAAGEGWELLFKNGHKAYADLVIAADGANSRIRPYITDIKPFYSGVTGIEGAVYDAATALPEVHALLQDGKIFILGDGKSLIISSKGDGSMVFYAGFNCEEDWHRNNGIDYSDIAQVSQWFRQEYAGWASVWNSLFEKASKAFIVRPMYCIPPYESWVTLPNLTMLGDAAHLMPPYAGEGVNMAMKDALDLSIALTGTDHSSIPAAIAAYEQDMRQRAGAAAEQTLAQTASIHSAAGLKNLLEMFTEI